MPSYVGIDPGLSGGVALINTSIPNNGNATVRFCATPLIAKGDIDIAAVMSKISRHADMGIHVYLEKVWAFQGQGVSSAFKFGQVYGEMIGMIKTRGWAYTLITPQSWQKEMFKGVTEVKKNGKRDTKEMAKIACTRIFPDAELTATPRSRKAHDGIVDALLIADYCRRMEQ